MFGRVRKEVLELGFKGWERLFGDGKKYFRVRVKGRRIEFVGVRELRVVLGWL